MLWKTAVLLSARTIETISMFLLSLVFIVAKQQIDNYEINENEYCNSNKISKTKISSSIFFYGIIKKIYFREK